MLEFQRLKLINNINTDNPDQGTEHREPTNIPPNQLPITNYHLTNKQNMQNKPNFPNTQINLTDVPERPYIKNDALAPPKNKPKTKPICGKQTVAGMVINVPPQDKLEGLRSRNRKF